MSFEVKRVFSYNSTSGTLNSVSAGTVTAGPTLVMNDVAVDSLSVVATVLAETNTLTIDIVWQVSNDGSTWYRYVDANNTATTTLATGTGSADTAVTRVIAAPAGIYGWRLARASVLSGTATGASSDTYTLAYNYSVKPFS